MAAEMAEQPAALAALLLERAGVEKLARRIAEATPRWVHLAARGSSDNAGRYAQDLLGARHGLPVALALPSLHTLYGAELRLEGALVVGVSVSGQSPDVVRVIEDGRRQGALTLAVTATPSSPLGRAAELCLPLACGEERAVAATKSYTSQLMAFAMLSAALADDGEAWRELEAVPAAVGAALAAPAPGGALAQATRLAVLGRGYGYGTAHEVALKLKETGYLAAEPYSFADFLHGPWALVEPGFHVVLIAPSGATAAQGLELARRLRDGGALLTAVSDLEAILALADLPIPIPATPEWLAPLVSVVPGQRLAHGLALARGANPDAPRGLAKVTRTL